MNRKLYSLPATDATGREFSLNAVMTEAQYKAMHESGQFVIHMDRAGELLAIGDMDAGLIAQAEREGYRINGGVEQ